MNLLKEDNEPITNHCETLVNPIIMHKKIIFTLIALHSVFFLFSQDLKIDVVYLKNGSIIKGSLVEVTPQTVKIETRDGNLFVFKMEEVEKITKETDAKAIEKQAIEIVASPDKIYPAAKAKGYHSALEFAAPVGIGELNKTYGFALGYSALYKFNNTLLLGGGTGAHLFLDRESGSYIGIFIPLYADFRMRFTDTRYSPFLVFKPGANMLQIDASAKNSTLPFPRYAVFGFYGNIGIGIEGYLNPKLAWTLSAAYQANSYFFQGKGEILNFATIGIGFRF